MARQDDPTISGEIFFLRRIPPWAERVTWNQSGVPIPSSQNFRDKDEELSVNIEHETTIKEALAGCPGFGLVRLSAQIVRQICGQAVIICRDPPPPSHVLICGKLTGSMRDKLKRAAQWVQFPEKHDPVS